MSTDFIDDFETDDTIEAIHVYQFSQPIKDLESGAALYRDDIGTGDAYKVNFFNETPNVVTSYTPGLLVYFKAGTANEGAATLTIQGSDGQETPSAVDLAAIPLVKKGGEPLETGDISERQVVAAIYTEDTAPDPPNPRFEVLGISSSAGPTTPVAVADGGTGATNPSDARSNLGVQAQDDTLDEISTLSLAKGDILVHDGSEITKLSPGSNGQVLSADSAETTGLKWAAPGGSAEELNDLDDVEITAPTTGQVLRYDGDDFVNADLAIADVDGLQAAIDAKQDELTAISDVPGLVDALGDKQDELTSVSDVPGLNDALSDKANFNHTHAASDITSGTLLHEQGGLEADVSAYSGLVKITGGTTSQASPGTDYYAPGSIDVTIADGGTGASSAQDARANLGLEIGTDVQAQNSLLSDVAGLSVSPGDLLYVDSSSDIVRLPKGADDQVLTLTSGYPSWGDAPGGGEAGGLLYTYHPSPSGYLEANGQIVSQATYPQLYSQIGLIADVLADGETWVAQTTPGTTTMWGVVYGNGLFVAVGNSGTVWTSPNAKTWTSQSTLGAGLRRIIYASGLFVVTGPFGKIWTSPDGENWTDQSTPSSSSHGITYGNGTFVAVGSNGKIWTSPDGENWTLQSTPSSTFMAGVTYGDGKFVAVGSNGTVWTSPDSENWTNQTTPGTPFMNDVIYENNLFVAVGMSGTVWTSPDGENWTSQSTPSSNPSVNGITYGNGLFVAAGNISSSDVIWTSPDGENWTSQTNTPGNRFLQGITFGNGTFVTVGGFGAIWTNEPDYSYDEEEDFALPIITAPVATLPLKAWIKS